MATLLVPTAEGVALRFEIAGAGSRLAAGIVDGVILGTAVSIVGLALMIAMSFDSSGISGFVGGIFFGGVLLTVLAYHILFHVLSAGQTPGKRWVGIRVMSADGYPPSTLAIVLRALVWPLDVLVPVPAPLGLILIAATPKHQRLGDLAAGTLVMRVARSESAAEPFPRELWSTLPVRTLSLTPGLAARLGAHDLEFLRRLLTRTDLEAEERRRLFVDTARQYSDRLELGPFEDARVVLNEIYLFGREMSKTRAV
jgi:uncharacterized RDD family membrane protein YckC